MYAIVAQSVEHYIGNVEVAGSIPAVSSMSPGLLSWGFFCFCVGFVAGTICFHSRAVEFCKSAFITFGFFGTLCTRPATKSKISARASRLQNLPNYSHPERRRHRRRSRTGITSEGQVFANKIILIL